MSITRMRDSFSHFFKPVLIVLLVVFIIGIWQMGNNYSGGDKVAAGNLVATINNDVQVSRDEYQKVYENLYKQQSQQAEQMKDVVTPAMGAQIKMQALTQVINQKMWVAAAKKEGLAPRWLSGWMERRRERPKFIDEEMKTLREQAAQAIGKTKITDKEFDLVLSTRIPHDPPYTAATMRAEIEKNYADDAMVDQRIMVEKLFNKIKASAGNIDENKAREYYSDFSGRQIVIMPMNGLTDSQAKTRAENVLKEIKSGGDFAKLAGQYSSFPDAKKTGGAFTGMNPMYDKDLSGMKVGQVSGVIKSQFGGYRIVKVEKITPPADFDKTKKQKISQLRDQLQMQAVQEYSQKMQSTMKVDIKDPELKGYWIYSKAMTATSQPERDKAMDEALTQFKKATANGNADASILVTIAQIQQMQNKNDDAIATLSDILDGRKLVENAELRTTLASLQIQKKDMAAAKANIEKASTLAVITENRGLRNQIIAIAKQVGADDVVKAQTAWMTAHPDPNAQQPLTMKPAAGTKPAPKK